MSADELLDVLDVRGSKTGQVLAKSLVHRQGLWHAGAHVWIYNAQGEVLLQLRAADKEIYPGIWDISAAGHLQAGDDYLEGALRETQEELGLQLAASELEFVGITRTIQEIPGAGYTHRVFDANYLVYREFESATLQLQTEELAGARWWSLDAFESALQDPEACKQFSPRPRYFYDLAITEMRRSLQRREL